MLAKYYRFRIKWDADQTLTYDDGARILIRWTPWKFASGGLYYANVVILNDDDWATWGDGQTILDEGEVESVVQDNTTNLYLGGKGYFEMTADATSTDGQAELYMEESDDNVNWPSDQADFDISSDLKLLAILSFSTDAVDESRGCNFSVN